MIEEVETPSSSFLRTIAVAEIATKGLFGEGLSHLELLELCTAVLREIARLRSIDLVEEDVPFAI